VAAAAAAAAVLAARDGRGERHTDQQRSGSDKAHFLSSHQVVAAAL
jgi:hypothetical protein